MAVNNLSRRMFLEEYSGSLIACQYGGYIQVIVDGQLVNACLSVTCM